MQTLTPQLAQACERWLADKVLIDLLKQQEVAALKALGDTLDTNGMLRAQGAYKNIHEFIKFIEAGASSADRFRSQPRNVVAAPTFDFRN